MQIKHKLILGVVLFVIFVTFDTYTLLNDEKLFVQNTTTIVKESIENQYINDIRILMLLNYEYLDDYIETQNPTDLVVYDANKAKMINEIDAAMQLAAELNEDGHLESLQNIRNDIHVIFDDGVKIISLTEHDKHDEAVQIQITSLEPKVLYFDKILNELSLNEQSRFSNEFKDFLSNVHNSTISLIIFYITLTVSHTVIVIFITKSYSDLQKKNQSL